MNQTNVLRKHSTTDFWESRANKVLSHFNYAYPDEIDIYQICWRYGVDILPLDVDFFNGDLTDEMKSFSYPIGKKTRGKIFIKQNLSYIEKKVILAEEFCHIHAHYANQLAEDRYQINKSEQQAKKMAAYLLMPYRFLENHLQNECYNQAVLVSEIAEHFLVTEELAHYRLELLFKQHVDIVTSIRGRIGSIQLFEE